MAIKKIVILATGGTIAGRSRSAGDNVGYTAAQVGIDEMLVGIPVPAGFEAVAEQVAQVDSKDMSFDIWRTLAQRCSDWLAQPAVAGIVITHGTDTLEETAYLLHRVLGANKPVVLTCAMRPATSLAPDGPQNVADAMKVAAADGAKGVVAVCAGVVHAAIDVAKQHTYRLDAFTSGDAGPVGYVEEGAVRICKPWPAVAHDAASDFASLGAAARWPRVEIVMNYAGASAFIVDALVERGVQGIVAAGTGNGTLNAELEQALVRARNAGVDVVRATRCAQGRVIAHAGATIEDSAGLSPVKARVDQLLRLLR
ncbi:asparaginase [Caenimonas koreensis]|uniref:asparaginase n=1 Tax=Caenimonas koreensis TaxID=367474 RepID=UPI003783A98E